MPEHNTITDPELHEPKGVAAATSGQVYIANGAASGAWKKLSTSTVYINALADLPTPSGGTITLSANTQYLLGADVSIGTDRLVLADNTTIRGVESLVVTLTYTGSGAMFTMSDTTNRISHLTLACASGDLFDWTCTSLKIFRCHDVTVSSCNKIGTFTGVSGILRFTTFSPAAVTTNGFTFVGDFDSFLYEVSATTMSAGNFLQLGTATFDSFITDTVLLTLNGSSVMLSGAAASANITTGGAGLISRMRIKGSGTLFSGITDQDALWEFRGNDDIMDTRPDGMLSLSSNSTNTVISTQSVPVLAAGTWVVQTTSQFTGTTAGRLTYVGGKDARIPITARVSIEPASGIGKTMGVTIAKNGTPISESLATSATDSGDSTSINAIWQVDFSTNDFIEVFLSNETDTIDVLGTTAVLRVN